MQTTPEMHIQLVENLHFIAHSRSGNEIHLDSNTDAVNSSNGTSPMELQLIALAGCTGMDVISILRKMRQDVTAYDLRVSGERATEHPRVYTSILLTHGFCGHAVSEANVRRAIELSMTRYCPVFAMLNPTVPIHERYEIVDGADGAAAIEGEVILPPETESAD